MEKIYWDSASTDDADIVIFGIPYDKTASYQKGTVFGPEAFRSEADALETYSPYFDSDLEDLKISDIGDVKLDNNESPEEMNKIVKEFILPHIINGKKIVMIGGEHSVSFPVIDALNGVIDDLHIIQFDAHTDLRDEFMGSKYSHACVMKRAFDLLGPKKIFQHGIRSGLKEEFDFNGEKTFIEKFTVNDINKTVATVKKKNVYITIDIDVLDPSIVCGTGTPEPGGITYNELLGAIKEMSKLHNVVGFDVVELAPKLDISNTSTAVCIKTVREMILSTLK